MGGDLNLVEKLISHDNINQTDQEGNTALIIAVVCGKREIVDLLIEKGADVTKKNVYGKIAMDLCEDDEIK